MICTPVLHLLRVLEAYSYLACLLLILAIHNLELGVKATLHNIAMLDIYLYQETLFHSKAMCCKPYNVLITIISTLVSLNSSMHHIFSFVKIT